MPIYEYECDSCGHRTELLQRVGAPAVGECSECGGILRRQVSAPAFQFKGTGWYVTDYAKKGRASDSADPSKSKNGSSGDSPKSSDKSESSKKESKSTSSD